VYLAEIHGKLSNNNENREDILTSNVFSFFKYANRQVFLYALMQFLSLDISNTALNDAEFIFWPTYTDNTEPDLVIIIGSYYLLVETKYHSGFGKVYYRQTGTEDAHCHPAQGAGYFGAGPGLCGEKQVFEQ